MTAKASTTASQGAGHGAAGHPLRAISFGSQLDGQVPLDSSLRPLRRA